MIVDYYHVQHFSYPDEENLEETDIRPRARHKRAWEDVSYQHLVMVTDGGGRVKSVTFILFFSFNKIGGIIKLVVATII